MSETYCGKSCQECASREEMACPGCKAGPGRPTGGDCDLAGCAWRKGKETCDACSSRPTCSLMRRREEMPAKRQHKLEYQQFIRERAARNAPVLGKWLWILLWLVIPGTAGDVMTWDYFKEAVPGLMIAGVILQVAVMIAYSLILLKLGDRVSRYRTAGICGLVYCGITLSMSSVFSSLLLAIPQIVMALVYEYQEFSAHSEALLGVDNRLANRWNALWKWNLVANGTILAGTILAVFLQSLLWVVLVRAATVGAYVLNLLKLVTLYQSAQCFRKFGK